MINEVHYQNGMIHGEWRDYYKTGEVSSITMYKYDKKDGLEVHYHINGNKKSETIYKDDIQIYETLRWDVNGRLIK